MIEEQVDNIEVQDEPIYRTKDGQTVTKSQLAASGYDDERVNKGLQNGVLKQVGDTKNPDQIFKTKDGQQVTTKDLLASGYSQDRIDKGIINGILSPYIEDISVKKKESTPESTTPVQATSSNTSSVSETPLLEKEQTPTEPISKEPIPIVTDYGNGEMVNPKDPFAMSKAANDFSKRTINTGVTGETSEVLPDEKSIKASQEINKDLEKQGFKSDFAIAVNDLPDDVFNETPKEQLATLYKENPLKFKQLTNELKTRHAIRQGAYDAANENIPDGKDKEKLSREQAILESNEYNINEIAVPETMEDLRGMMEVKQQSINRNISNPDTKKKLQERLRDTYASTINANSLNLKDEYENSDVRDIVDINQYAGLETLRIFDPAKYENYKNVIQQKITPLYSVGVNVSPEEKQIINTPDSAFAAQNNGVVSPLTISQKIGQETVLRELNAIGLGNAAEQLYSQRSDLIATQNNIVKESERKDITPEELGILQVQFEEANQKVNAVQAQIGELEKLEKADDARYPQTAQLKFDSQVKEMVEDDGKSVGAFMWNKFGHGMGSSVDAIENLLVSNFGSKDDKAALSMKRIGEQQKFDAKTYLPESERRINSPVIMQFDDGLEKEVKKVLNGRSLGDLSETERNGLIELVKNNQDKIKTITNPEAGKSKNFLSKATVMTVAGFTAEIAAFMAKMALLRGAGIGAKTAEAEVLFMDGYNHSVQQKLAEGYSMDEANSYGILHGAILSTMVQFGSKFEAVKKIMAGGKSPLSKQIAGMSEETWNAIYNKNKSFIQRLGKSTKSVAGEQVKMIGTFAGIAPTADAIADNVFYNADNTVGQVAETVIEGSIDMAIGGLPLIGFGLAKGSMKTKATPLEKAALWNLGDQPTMGKSKIDEAVTKGDLTKEEGEIRKKTIDEVSSLIQKVPTKTDKGKLMTDEQRSDYLFNLTVQQNAKQEAKDLPPNQAAKEDYKALVAEYNNEIALETPTQLQLESRKKSLENQIAVKDEDGKLVLNEKEIPKVKAQLEAVNNELETRKSFEKVEMKKREFVNTKLSEPLPDNFAGGKIDEQGVPIGEDVPPPTEQSGKENIEYVQQPQQSGKDVVVGEGVIIHDGQEYANTPRIKELIKEADKITENLPPVEDGYVRLWRGNREGEIGKNPQFTNSLVGIALPFKKGYGGNMSYVDVLKSDLPKYEQGAGTSRGNEFIVPPEIASKAIEIKEQSLSTKPEQKSVNEGVVDNLKDVGSTAKALDKLANDNPDVHSKLEEQVGVMYHGTEADFDKFDRVGQRIPALGLGYYFTPTLEKAKQYGSKIKKIVLEGAKILNWNKLSDTEREQIKQRLEERIPKDMGGLGERKEKVFTKDQRKEASDFLKEKQEQTKDYYYERGKARASKKGEDFVVSWSDEGLGNLTDAELLNLAQQYDNNIGNAMGYDAAKYGSEIAVFNGDKIKNATNEVIAEAYHKAKADGTNPELVKAVEQSLKEQPIQKSKPDEGVVDKTEEKSFTKNALDRADAKKIFAQVREVDTPQDAAQVALEYIANGGKVSETAINEVAGTVKRASLNTGARELKSSEAKARDYSDKKAETLDELAHNLWELNGQRIPETEIKDALMDVIGSHNTRLDAGKAYLERYSAEYNEKKLQEKFYQEHLKEVADELEFLNNQADIEKEAMADENYVTNLIEKYETESKGQNQQSATETKGSINEGVGNQESAGQKEEKIKAAQSEVDKAKAALKKAEDKFAVTQAKQGNLLGGNEVQKDLFANNPQEVKSVLDPLKQKVREAEANLEQVKKSIGTDNGQPKLFTSETKPIKNEETQTTEIPNKKTGDSPIKPETGEATSATTEGKEAGKEPPPIEPTETVGEKKGGKMNDKGVLNHLESAKNVPEAARAGFKEKGLKYETKSQKEAEDVAKSIIDEYGIEDAVLLAEAQKFDGDVNSLIYAESLNRLGKMEAEAKTPEERIAIAKKFAEVGIKYDEAGRKGGSFSSAINYFYKKSPLGIQMMENAKRKEQFEEFAKPKDKSWKEFFDEMVKEPEFDAIIKEQVKEGMKQERAEARAARIKKVDEFFDKAKDQFKGGAAYSTIIPPKVITTALEGMKKAYHAGEKVAKIIEDAIDYISNELGSASWDKQKFRKEWEEKLQDKPEKKKLTDEEVKAKILDKFRNKLKGLSDKQKEDVVRKSFQKIVESGGLDYADFRKIIADVTGRGEMTEAEATKLKELVAETNKVDDAGKKAREERTTTALRQYREAEISAGKAQRELNTLLYNRPNITKRLTSMLQLNTLGIAALVNNPVYNVINHLGLRLPTGLVRTGVDRAIQGVAKMFGKDVMPETDVLSLQVQREFFKKLGLGTREAVGQFVTGLNRMDYIQKEIHGQQIRPLTSMKELWEYSQGKRNLTKRQIIDKALQAVPQGWTAEIIARTLNLGDKPQRFAAEGAQAAAFAKNLGLKDIDYDLFIEFPREEAYQQYKKKGWDDAKASKQADYIRDTIVKEGERSTFQQDNFANDILNRMFGGKDSGVGGLAKSTVISPYIKIPSNAYWSYFNIVNPEVAMLQSAIYGYKAFAKRNGDVKFSFDKHNSTGAKDLHEAKYWFAHAAVGFATRAVITSLVAAGVFRSSNTEDDTKKEREGEQNFEAQGTVNVNKLWAYMKGEDPSKVKNGLVIDKRWFGHFGSVGNTIAKREEELTEEQKKNRSDYFDEMLANLSISGLKELEQGIFGNTSSLLTAIDRGGVDMQRWGVNTMNLFTNIIHPAAFAQVSKNQLPYYTKTKADTFKEELKNAMLTRSSLLRKLSGQYPPSKVSIWGEKIEKEGSIITKLFGISKANDDNFAQPIYEDYKKTDNTKFFPSAVKPEITVNGERIKLPTKEAYRLEELVGQQRKNLLAPYINDMAKFEGEYKVYSKLSDEEKLKKLDIIYDMGFERGKELFIKEFPKYKSKNKSLSEEQQKKKDSEQNKILREALSKKPVVKK